MESKLPPDAFICPISYQVRDDDQQTCGCFQKQKGDLHIQMSISFADWLHMCGIACMQVCVCVCVCVCARARACHVCMDVKAAHGGSRHVMRRNLVPAVEHFALAGKFCCRLYRCGRTVLPSNDLTLLIHAFTLSPSHAPTHAPTYARRSMTRRP